MSEGKRRPTGRLSELRAGQSGVVHRIDAVGQQRRHLLDLGFIPGTTVTMLRKSPSGDPKAFRVRGTTLALRREQTECIVVDGVDEEV